MEIAGKLELHYFLENNSHSMDAIVRNKCEAEALALIKEIAVALDIHIVVESVAHQEGGLKEILQFIGENSNQLTFFLSVIVFVFSRIPTSDREQDKLTKDLTRLSIEEKTLAIEKLKRELQTNNIHIETVASASVAIDSDLRVAVRKSNFYKNLDSYRKVTGVGFTALNKDSVSIENERYVPRSDFKRFILLSDKLPMEVIEGAKIEIVSPVLREGNYHWKGIYQNMPINFTMIDKEFKNSVLQEQVTFQHGSVIECVLNIHRKFNEVGDIVITGYSVSTVIKKTDGHIEHETIQGKRYVARKEKIKSQMSLFTYINE